MRLSTLLATTQEQDRRRHGWIRSAARAGRRIKSPTQERRWNRSRASWAGRWPRRTLKGDLRARKGPA